MLRTTKLLIALCGLCVAGCQSSTPMDETFDTSLDPGSVVPVAHEVYSDFPEPDRFVVRTPEHWARVWKRTFAGRSEIPSRPAVDFSTEMILVAAQGSQGSSGYDISIDRVVRRAGELSVDVTTTSPARNCYALAVITSPVVMVRIPAIRGRVEFRENSRTVSCE